MVDCLDHLDEHFKGNAPTHKDVLGKNGNYSKIQSLPNLVPLSDFQLFPESTEFGGWKRLCVK